MGGQDRVVGPVPIVSAEGTVFPSAILQGEIRQTLPMVEQVGTAIVASERGRTDRRDVLGDLIHEYSWASCC